MVYNKRNAKIDTFEGKKIKKEKRKKKRKKKKEMVDLTDVFQ